MSEEEIIARLRAATELAGGSENDELNNKGNENIEFTHVHATFGSLVGQYNKWKAVVYWFLLR